MKMTHSVEVRSETVNRKQTGGYWYRSLDAQYKGFSLVLEEKVASDMSSIDELVDLLYETEMYVLREYYK